MIGTRPIATQEAYLLPIPVSTNAIVDSADYNEIGMDMESSFDAKTGTLTFAFPDGTIRSGGLSEMASLIGNLTGYTEGFLDIALAGGMTGTRKDFRSGAKQWTALSHAQAAAGCDDLSMHSRLTRATLPDTIYRFRSQDQGSESVALSAQQTNVLQGHKETGKPYRHSLRPRWHQVDECHG